MSERSPRGSVFEKPPQFSQVKAAPLVKSQFNAIEEELAHLPYKENEVQSLARQIGIDYETEKEKYLWFLAQVVNLDLPPGWMREEDPDGAIYYHNPGENLTTQKHPMIAKFRSLFNEILENEMLGKTKILALREKVQKLEQQEKESQIQSQPAKKQYAPLKNEKFKKVRAAASIIALTAALGNKVKGESNAEKLKALPEQPQEIVDTERAKERFDKVKELLEKRRNNYESKVNEVDNLVRTEEILNICKQHYIEKYGLYHKEAPPSITQVESYDMVDPTGMIEAARLFNVKSTQAYLFWILRAYCGLPLPEYWSKVFDTNLHREIYYNSCYDVKISVRPCYFYVLELVNYVKHEVIRDKESFLNFSNKMSLCDKLGRQYDVDLASMIKDLIEKPNSERKNYFTYHQKKEVNKEDAQKIVKKRKKEELNPNFSDAHLFEIANQLGLDLNSELHLLMVIEEFVRKREGTERWFFRQVPDGPAFWVNHEQQKAVNRYPYLKELKKEIDDAKKNFANNLEDAKRYLKSEWSLIKALFRKHPEATARKMILDEARNFVEFFLKLKGEANMTGSNVEGKGYNLSNFLRKVGTQISKGDIMDLLFYCPFDFSQFISDEFLRSTESYLLKKIHQKNVSEALGDAFGELDDMRMRHDASFNSEGSNDSANKIRIKIEDSKKLLDLASNIKGLSLDPEKKREFMKLLIDFDQKYGDHDLVDALEKDLTTNIADEAALTQDLVDHIKQAIGQELLKDEVPGSSKSKDSKNLQAQGDQKNNSGQEGLRKDSPDLLNQAFNGSSNVDNYNFEGRNLTKNDPSSNSTFNSQAHLLQDISKIQDGRFSKNGLQTETENNQSSSAQFKLEPRSAAENDRENHGQALDDPHYQKDGRKSTEYDQKGLHSGRVPQEGADMGGESNSAQNTEGNNENKGTNRGKQQKRNKRTDSNDTLIEKWDSENGDDDDYNNSRDQIGGTENKNGGQARVPGMRIANQKLEYDENGKIIFTRKKTQEMLESLAEEQARLSSRSLSRKATGRMGSFGGSAEDGLLLDNRERSQFGNENEIVYQEVILENGEKKLIPVILNQNSATRQHNKTGSVISQRDRSSNHSPEQTLSPSARNREKDANNRNETLPGITGVPFHLPFGNRADPRYADISFDPQVMRDSFNKYNGGLDGKNLLKNDLRKSLGSSKLPNDGKPGHPLFRFRGGVEQQDGHPQTYKTLEPGLQHLDMVRARSYDRHPDKPGVWTHVELFEIEGNAFQYDQHGKPIHNPALFDKMTPQQQLQYLESYRRAIPYEQTFYTPFRRGNLGAKRFLEYMTYLNTVVFMRKLDGLITDFLMKQFAAIQQQTLGIEFQPEDPIFRKLFKKRYQKLIKRLRENLLKKKDFIQSVYSKIFNTSDNNIPDIVLQSISHINNYQNSKMSMMMGSVSDHAQKNGELFQDLKLDATRQNKNVSLDAGAQSHKILKLPSLTQIHKEPTQKFRGYKKNSNSEMGPSKMFDDNNIRSSEYQHQPPAVGYSPAATSTGFILKKNKAVLSQKELDAQKILKVINDNDRENYKHYWNLLGDPLKLESTILFSKIDLPLGVQPYHIVLMGHRLGVQIHNIEEPDLAWILYLALAVRGPESMETNLSITSPKTKMRYHKICNMKFGEHPGDKYFKTVVIYNQMRRKILLENLTEEDQTLFVKSQSWVKLREESGSIYYYNFLTKAKTQNFPATQKQILQKFLATALKPEVKEKLRLTNQVLAENDQLFGLFKNKVHKI